MPADAPSLSRGAPLPRLPSLSCFFPAYNEEANIGPLIEEAVATLPAFADTWEVIVVDDGSTDGTADVVAAASAVDPRVRLVRHDANLGYGSAIRTGLAASNGELVFFSDADRQFRLSDLALLVPAIAGADLAIGYRVHRQDALRRLLIARVYHRVVRHVLGLDVRDVDCAFKLLRREVVTAVAPELSSRAATVSPELLLRARRRGFLITEVGVPHHPRQAGIASGAAPKVILRTVIELLRLRRTLTRSRPALATQQPMSSPGEHTATTDSTSRQLSG